MASNSGICSAGIRRPICLTSLDVDFAFWESYAKCWTACFLTSFLSCICPLAYSSIGDNGLVGGCGIEGMTESFFLTPNILATLLACTQPDSMVPLIINC